MFASHGRIRSGRAESLFWQRICTLWEREAAARPWWLRSAHGQLPAQPAGHFLCKFSNCAQILHFADNIEVNCDNTNTSVTLCAVLCLWLDTRKVQYLVHASKTCVWTQSFAVWMNDSDTKGQRWHEQNIRDFDAIFRENWRTLACGLRR